MEVISFFSNDDSVPCVVTPLEWNSNQHYRKFEGYWYKPGIHTWHRHTMSASDASKSTSFPFPSSPHWAPRTTVTRLSSFTPPLIPCANTPLLALWATPFDTPFARFPFSHISKVPMTAAYFSSINCPTV